MDDIKMLEKFYEEVFESITDLIVVKLFDFNCLERVENDISKLNSKSFDFEVQEEMLKNIEIYSYNELVLLLDYFSKLRGDNFIEVFEKELDEKEKSIRRFKESWFNEDFFGNIHQFTGLLQMMLENDEEIDGSELQRAGQDFIENFLVAGSVKKVRNYIQELEISESVELLFNLGVVQDYGLGQEVSYNLLNNMVSDEKRLALILEKVGEVFEKTRRKIVRDDESYLSEIARRRNGSNLEIVEFDIGKWAYGSVFQECNRRHFVSSNEVFDEETKGYVKTKEIKKTKGQDQKVKSDDNDSSK